MLIMKYKLRYDINPRCYINKFGIIDEAKLAKVESVITHERKNDILSGKSSIEMSYDIDMMKELHKYLFQDLYDWAGYVRSEPDEILAYKSILFTHPLSVEKSLNDVFADIKKDNFLRGFSKHDMAYKASEYFSRFNKIHPFFEGNGRVQKLIISDLLFRNDYVMNLSKISEYDVYDANMSGLKGYFEPLAKLYESVMFNVNKYNQQLLNVKQVAEDKGLSLGENKGVDYILE